MIYLWNQLKKRHFEKPRSKEERKNKKTTYITLDKRDYIEMINSFFKLMINGLNNDRVKKLRKIINSGKPHSLRKAYKKLVNEVYDEKEYRLPLWLPLSLEEKLDMILH